MSDLETGSENKSEKATTGESTAREEREKRRAYATTINT